MQYGVERILTLHLNDGISCMDKSVDNKVG